MGTEIIEAIPHRPEADSFDFQKSLEVVKQALFCHKALIAGTMAATVLLVIVYMMAFPANFEARVILIADSTEDAQRGEFYNHWNVFRRNALNDEGEMMVSAPLVGKVVDELELKYEDVYHSFMNHVGYLWVESWIGKAYRKVKYSIFPRPTLYSLSPEELERGKTILSFKDGIILQPFPETNLAALVARGPSPRIADTLNVLVDHYLLGRKERMLEEADTAYAALKQEADKSRAQLLDLELQLEKHHEENNMLLTFEKDKLQVTTWLKLQSSIVELESQKAHLTATLKEIDRQLESEEKNVVGSRVQIKNSARVTLRNQIVQLKIAMEQTKLRYSPGSPEVTEIQAQIDALTELWSAEEEVEQSQAIQSISETYQALQTQKSTLQAELSGIIANLEVKRKADKEMDAALKLLPKKINQTRALDRERSLLEISFNGLSQKLATAAISRATIASAPPAIRVVTYAEYPEKPIWPKTKLLLLGALIVGAIMGVLAAIILDFIYARVSRYRLSATSSQLEVYAIVTRDTKFLASLYDLAGPESEPPVKRLQQL
ncbi:MAG: GumC family protein [Halioglobus sp.]